MSLDVFLAVVSRCLEVDPPVKQEPVIRSVLDSGQEVEKETHFPMY